MSSLKYQIGVQAFLPSNIGPAHIRMDLFNKDTSVVKVKTTVTYGDFSIVLTALPYNKTSYDLLHRCTGDRCDSEQSQQEQEKQFTESAKV